MYTATVPILTLSSFVPYTPTGPNMSATFGAPINTSALPGSSITTQKGNPNGLFVSVPPTYVGAVQITFQLPLSDYVLLGIAVKPAVIPKGKDQGKKTVGRQEFRTITVNRDPSGSQVTVTDACILKFGDINFDYLILVQEVASGNVGAIDPDWENEPGE